MAILTAEQKKKYLAAPGACPFCDSNNIEGGEIDAEGREAWQHIQCLDCSQEWRDTYTLSGVETDDDDRKPAAYRCDNCGHVDTDESLVKEIAHYSERISEGGPEPSGECSKCGSLSYEQ